MNNTNYDFDNAGYKLHLPVNPDCNDQLTSKVVAHLDDYFGTTQNSRWSVNVNGNGQYYSPGYKVGLCGEAITGGKGITIYGRFGTRDEMQTIANELESKFGKEFNECIQQNSIQHPFVDNKLTSTISGRFAGHNVYHPKANGSKFFPFMQYNYGSNPSGAETVRAWTNPKGQTLCYDYSDVGLVRQLSDADKKFINGDSTLATIDHYGELFTGKLENGKAPKWLIDSFAPEYLAQHPNLENELSQKIVKGTNTLVANMLEDIAKNGKNSTLFKQGICTTPWFTTLEPATIDNAKKLLAYHEPQIVQNLEDLLPKLTKTHPSLAVLEQTTPLAKMTGVDMSKVVVGQIHQTPAVKAPVAPTATPVAQPTVVNNPATTTPVTNPVAPKATVTAPTPAPSAPNPAATVQTPHTVNTPSAPQAPTHTPNPTSATTKAVEEGMSKTKIGLIVAGVALAAVGAYMFFKKDKKEEVAKAPQQEFQPIQQQPAFGQSSSIFNQNPMYDQQSTQGYMPQYAYPQMNMYQGTMRI